MSATRPELSIVIPAYNEAERIAPTLLAVDRWAAAQPYPVEVIVVDDGSSDDTGGVVVALGLPSVKLLASRPNRGKGHAVRLGMLSARGRLRLFMDADHSTPIAEVGRLAERIEAGADVAIGSRRAPGATQAVRQPWYRRAWSRLANRVVRAGLLAGIHDTQCGFKLFRAEAAEAIFGRLVTDGWGFDLEVLAHARALGYGIDEVPVAWSDDRRSRILPLADAWRIVGEFLRIRRQFAVTRRRRAPFAMSPRRGSDPWGPSKASAG